MKRKIVFLFITVFLFFSGWAQIVIQSGRVYEVGSDGRGCTDLGSVGDYFKEKEGDSENKDSPENDQPQGGYDGGDIKKQNEEDVEEFIEETEGVENDTVSDEASEEISQCENQEEKTEKEETIAEEQKEKNQTEQKKQENKEKAETGGDPVILSTGEYVQTDTDFYLKNDFYVTRFYNSGNPVTGNFGLGWSSVFDERLIFCRYINADLLLNYHKELLDLYKKSFEELPQKIKNSYGVSSLEKETALREIDEKINYYNKVESQGKIALEKARVLNITFGESEYEGRVQKRLNVIGEKKSFYEKARQKISCEITFYETLQTKILEEEKSCFEYEKQIQINNLHEKENKASIYKGTPDSWVYISGEKILYIDKNNIPHRFSEKSDSVWGPDRKNEHRFIQIEKNKNGEYELKAADGSVRTFYPNGLLKSITDRNGNYTRIERIENGQVMKIRNNLEEVFSVVYKNNYVSDISNLNDSSERTEYSYIDGKLTGVTDSEGDCICLSYNSDNKLVKLQKPDGTAILFVPGEQTSEGNFLFTETRNEEGFSEFFYYDLSSRKAMYVDHDGNKTDYAFDSDNHTVYKCEPDGGISGFIYDSNGNLTEEIYNNNKIQNFYDEMGNCIRKVYPDGSSETFSYNSFGQIVFYSDRDDVCINIEYDEKGNLIGLSKNNQLVFTQENDSYGRKIKKVYNGDPAVTQEWAYDKKGNLILERTGKREVSYEYDSRNRVISIFINGDKELSAEYDNHKKVLDYSSGLKNTYEYNNRKDLVKITREDTVAGEKHITEYEYDSRHLPVREYEVIGDSRILTSEKLYSPEGRLVMIKNYDGTGGCLVTEYSVEY